MKILLVEDHVDSATVVALWLMENKHDVTTALNLADARRACESSKFDLLICDLVLPDGDGHDFLAELRKTCNIPAIAISADAFPANIKRSLDAGFAAHVCKPFSLASLMNTVDKALVANLDPYLYRPINMTPNESQVIGLPVP